MSILFDATRRVKSARKPFGLGILASRPVYFDAVGRADREWAAANLNQGCTDFATASDAELEQAAGESLAMDRMESGAFGAF